MVEQIKKLRVKIDGLSQMVKLMSQINYIQLLPDEDFDAEKIIKVFKQTAMLPIDSPKFAEILPINSSYINNIHNSLRLTKAWLGVMLKELGEKDPYDVKTLWRYIQTVEEIMPATDVAIVSDSDEGVEYAKQLAMFTNLNPIEKIDFLRKELKTIIEEEDDFSEEAPYIEQEQSFAYQHLTEAKFYLGFILQEFKENETS